MKRFTLVLVLVLALVGVAMTVPDSQSDYVYARFEASRNIVIDAYRTYAGAFIGSVDSTDGDESLIYVLGAAEKETEEAEETKGITVYITKTGSKYHKLGCRYLSKSRIPIELSSAKKKYGACSVCKPPR